MYTLDVFSAVVWDGCIHFQESHAKVSYPTGRNTQTNNDWIVGWNFTTDLYRILEHDLNKLRSKNSQFNQKWGVTLPTDPFDQATTMYSQLPSIFQDIQSATGNPEQDIYGFQAANIQATLALLRMVSLSLEIDIDLDKKCTVVSEVLSTFHRVPDTYLRAISTPIVYHIGGIGTILGSVMESPLTDTACHRIRDLLVSMAGLLDSCEAFLRQDPGASQKLRDLAARIEGYMEERINTSVSTVVPQADTTGITTSDWPEMSMDLSAVQLPSEIFDDWTWPFAASNLYPSS